MAIYTGESRLFAILDKLKLQLYGLSQATDLLLKSGLNNEQIGYLSMVNSCEREMRKLIDDTLGGTFDDSNPTDSPKKPFNIYLMIRETLAPFISSANDHGIDLTTSIGSNVPPYLIGEAAILSDSIAAVLAHLIRQSSSGELSVRFSVLQESGECIGLRIHIQSISKDEKTDQSDSDSGETVIENIRKALAEAGGSIRAKNSGSNFTIDMSFQKTNNIPAGIPADINISPQVNPIRYSDHNQALMDGKKVLMIDPNAMGRTKIEKQLKILGFHPDWAGSLQQAEELFKKATYTMVFALISSIENDQDTIRMIEKKRAEKDFSCVAIGTPEIIDWLNHNHKGCFDECITMPLTLHGLESAIRNTRR